MTAVDVIIPIFGAGAELAVCLTSLRPTIEGGRHRLVLVVDGPQPAEVEEALETASTLAEVNLLRLRNPSRAGFVASVNRGMKVSDRDVILLNSDTEVTPGWIEKLQRAAHSAPDIATATPFSNNATICSLPRFLEENLLPAGYDVGSFAALVERRSQKAYPDLPTGVGVCLYIKREVLNSIGVFDERRFGLGYGEEVEFCLRARAAGRRHVLDDATFIYHAGQSSFGSSRHTRVHTAHRVLRRLYPQYLSEVADFIRRDPLEPLRRRVTEALEPSRRPAPTSPPRRVVHLVHGWPPHNHAGTELYAQWLVKRQAARREVAVYGRVGDSSRELGQAFEGLEGGVRVRLVVNNFVQRDPLSRNGVFDRSLERDFARFLDQTRPDLLHVHHLAGHASNLLRAAVRRRIPILYQLQDWWTACARVNFFHRDRYLCPGPTPGRCATCQPLTRRPPRNLLNRLLHRLRRHAFRKALRHADAFVAGSDFLIATFRELGLLLPDDPVWVLPYGVDLATSPARGRRNRPSEPPLRFGYIGSMLPHKGVDIAVAAFEGIEPEAAVLDLWGDLSASPTYSDELQKAAPPAVRFRGTFPEDAKMSIFAGLDALLVPSLGFESFGLVAREAMAAGVPVLASCRGALAEMLATCEPNAGGSFPPGDVSALRGRILRLIQNPARLAAWSQALPPVKGMDHHAEEIEEVYREILRRRDPAARARPCVTA